MAKYLRQRRSAFEIVVASSEGVAERWCRQYPADRWPDKEKITKRLVELDGKGTPDETAAVIGNKSWTHPHCSACGEYREAAVEFGDGSDQAVQVCAECLVAAREALNSCQGNGS